MNHRVTAVGVRHGEGEWLGGCLERASAEMDDDGDAGSGGRSDESHPCGESH